MLIPVLTASAPQGTEDVALLLIDIGTGTAPTPDMPHAYAYAPISYVFFDSSYQTCVRPVSIIEVRIEFQFMTHG